MTSIDVQINETLSKIHPITSNIKKIACLLKSCGISQEIFITWFLTNFKVGGESLWESAQELQFEKQLVLDLLKKMVEDEKLQSSTEAQAQSKSDAIIPQNIINLESMLKSIKLVDICTGTKKVYVTDKNIQSVLEILWFEKRWTDALEIALEFKIDTQVLREMLKTTPEAVSFFKKIFDPKSFEIFNIAYGQELYNSSVIIEIDDLIKVGNSDCPHRIVQRVSDDRAFSKRLDGQSYENSRGDITLVAKSNKSFIIDFKEGDIVVRGPNWYYDNQDGGAGNYGKIVEKRSDSSCRVRWNRDHTYTYSTRPDKDIKVMARSVSDPQVLQIDDFVEFDNKIYKIYKIDDNNVVLLDRENGSTITKRCDEVKLIAKALSTTTKPFNTVCLKNSNVPWRVLTIDGDCYELQSLEDSSKKLRAPKSECIWFGNAHGSEFMPSSSNVTVAQVLPEFFNETASHVPHLIIAIKANNWRQVENLVKRDTLDDSGIDRFVLSAEQFERVQSLIGNSKHKTIVNKFKSLKKPWTNRVSDDKTLEDVIKTL